MGCMALKGCPFCRHLREWGGRVQDNLYSDLQRGGQLKPLKLDKSFPLGFILYSRFKNKLEI